MPHEARSAGDLTPTNYADKYVEFVARHFEWTEVRCGWRSQRQGILFREWDKWSRWGLDNGLHAVLTRHAPDDAETYAIDDQFTLGDSLLVAPVLAPGARARSVYLPEGRWRDYWNGSEHRGPVRLDAYPAPLETLPLFERMNP